MNPRVRVVLDGYVTVTSFLAGLGFLVVAVGLAIYSVSTGWDGWPAVVLLVMAGGFVVATRIWRLQLNRQLRQKREDSTT
jgi:hypothetical protein